MKKLLFASLILVLSFGVNFAVNATETNPATETEISAKDAERAKVLNERLIEIKEMDKSNMTAIERRELRSEVKAIKEELTQVSGGVYLSIGAIIVIILLLILLL
jgi:predicted PurR-regulated permease PerM